MDQNEAKEFAAMAVKVNESGLLADFDISQLPCALLAQFWYSILAAKASQHE